MNERDFEQQKEFKPHREKRRFRATPTDEEEVHWFEAEYEEIRPGVWQKVPGTEKDLGPVPKEKKEKTADTEQKKTE